jgi:hypothetical protein
VAVKKPKLLIAEGAEDCALVEAMAAADLITSDFSIAYIGEGLTTGFGITGLREYLHALPGLSRKLTAIGVMADNDLAQPYPPTATYVQNEIRAANLHPDVDDRYSVPTAPHYRAVSRRISTVLILAPGGNAAGCLETLLVSVLNDLYPAAMACVETLIACSNAAAPNGAPQWTPSKLDKARVRAAVAVLNRSKPQLPLASLWKREPDLIPVTHDLFKPLAAELSKI